MSIRRILLLCSLFAFRAAADEPWEGPYLYDGAGNITAIGTRQYRYDAAQRLLLAPDQSYSYDAFGNLLSSRPKAQGLAQLLAFGDPKLSAKTAADAVAFQRDANVGPLPDAEREVRTIRRFYPAGEAKVLVGAEASESAFKREAGRYRVLHVAAHGLFDENAPMYSAVLLSAPADGSEDGFLEAREIAELTLQSDVAVLSACNTARGRYGAGEGLVGMSWALQAAGIPSAIVSQWKASSKPTAELMIAFHRHLITGTSKSDALRRASLELMRDRRYAHPFYWAPFALIGAP